MKKLLTVGLLLLFATSSCIFVVSDTNDCAACKAKADSSYRQGSGEGDPIEYMDEDER